MFCRICTVLDGALDREPDVGDLARGLQVAAADIGRAVARAGSLGELIERRRLLAAYRLLRNPEETEPISAIAWRCSFTDVSRFNRRFREVFHASPTDLRHFRAGGLPDWAGAYHVESNYGRFFAG